MTVENEERMISGLLLVLLLSSSNGTKVQGHEHELERESEEFDARKKGCEGRWMMR